MAFFGQRIIPIKSSIILVIMKSRHFSMNDEYILVPNRSEWSILYQFYVRLLNLLGEARVHAEIEAVNRTLDPSYPSRKQAGSNAQAIKLILKLFIKLLVEMYRKAFYLNTWFILYDPCGDGPVSFPSFRKIIPPKDRFWADPHVISVNDHHYVFIEEFLYKSKKGHISVLGIDSRGDYTLPVKVLKSKTHLSYPFVFEWEGRYYLVPESAENHRIDLYECVEFPYQWKFLRSLMENVCAVDTTLFHYAGKWWLFTGIAENKAKLPYVKLYLFYSDDLFSQVWKPHPQNPIVSDVARARPAGSLFIKNGKIYRPSQDCSKMYGYGLYINEVLILSETEYLERKVASFKPDWDQKIKGIHTFSSNGTLTVIDAFTRRRRIF